MKMQMRVLAIIVALFWSASSQAGTVTSNLGNAFPGNAVFVGTFVGTDLRLGLSFTTDNTTYVLDAINIAATTVTPGIEPFTVHLHHESGGIPGAVITTLMGPASPNGIESYTPLSPVTLLPSTTYFVVAEAPAQGSNPALYGWEYLFGGDSSEVGPGSIGDLLVKFYTGDSDWSFGQFSLRMSVQGTAVPEASSFTYLVLLGAGLIGKHRLLRRRESTSAASRHGGN